MSIGNLVPDAEMLLADGTALTSSGRFQVNGSDNLIEGLDICPAETEIHCYISACDDADGNETYVLQVRGSIDSFGSSDELLGSFTVARGTTGRCVLGVKNYQFGVIYTSIALEGVLGGTTASITLRAQLGGKPFYASH